MMYPLRLRVNAMTHDLMIAPERSLLHVLRDDIGLTGTKEGCEDSECGACMVLLDGQPVNSCVYLALQAQGCEIETVEGFSSNGDLHPLQRHILEEGGVQCGYCTPGMLVSAKGLLDANPRPTEAEVRQAIAGNLCRCTGYNRIVRAILKTAEDLGSR